MGGPERIDIGGRWIDRCAVMVAVFFVVGSFGAGPAFGSASQQPPGSRAVRRAPGAVRSGVERPAVARCKDDSVSANTDFRNTCRTRGGIDHWATPYGTCADGTVIKLSRKASCKSHDGFGRLLAQNFVPQARKGDIAGCTDGTFTSEKRLSETCGNRGGVRRWLKTYGLCRDGHAIRMSTKASCKGHGGFKALLESESVPKQFGHNVALCNDGGYSDNLDFSATCSGGDGIDVWLASYGRCDDGAVIKMRNDSSCTSGTFDRLLPGDFKPIDAGYVALCSNGAYSANIDFKTTCDGSGGVRSWLATYGKCADEMVFRVDRDASCEGHAGYKALLAPGYVPEVPVPSNLTITTTSTPTTSPPPPTTRPYVPPTTPYVPPATASPAPVGGGATAQCNDGTLSYAEHHQGACSHHGGVSVFYK